MIGSSVALDAPAMYNRWYNDSSNQVLQSVDNWLYVLPAYFVCGILAVSFVKFRQIQAICPGNHTVNLKQFLVQLVSNLMFASVLTFYIFVQKEGNNYLIKYSTASCQAIQFWIMQITCIQIADLQLSHEVQHVTGRMSFYSMRSDEDSILVKDPSGILPVSHRLSVNSDSSVEIPAQEKLDLPFYASMMNFAEAGGRRSERF